MTCELGMQDLAMALLFVIGYVGIIFEESLAFNKSGVGLLMAVSLWVIRSIGVNIHLITAQILCLQSQINSSLSLSPLLIGFSTAVCFIFYGLFVGSIN